MKTACIYLWAVFVCLSLSIQSTHALNPYGFEQILHIGHVYARSVVYDKESGLPLWAIYDEDGGHTKIHPDLAKAYEGRVVSGDNYRAYSKAYKDFKAQYIRRQLTCPVRDN
ncbi:MAG: hypothetical protein RPT25_15490 [Cycloclasticus sp.]